MADAEKTEKAEGEFDWLSQPNMGDDEPNPEKDKGGEEEPSETAQLIALIQEQNRNIQDQVRQSNETAMGIAAGAQPKPQAPVAPQPREVSFDGLPDPVAEPQAYHTEVARRVQATTEANVLARTTYEREAAQHQQQGVTRADGLWDEFKDRYGDTYKGMVEDGADLESFAETAARRVLAKAQRRGVDPDTLMFGNTDRFFREVNDELGVILAPLAKKGDGEGEGEGEEEEANRTGGILGSKPAGTGGSQDVKDAEGNMISEIYDIQKKTGFL